MHDIDEYLMTWRIIFPNWGNKVIRVIRSICPYTGVIGSMFLAEIV
jgi:hypothetical protein